MQIPARYNGPPGSGNGGWSAGTFAEAAGASVDGRAYVVTLRVPPPLATELTLTGGKVLDPAGTLVAEVAADADAGAGVPVADPAEAGPYPGLSAHPFPGCYVCGPEHPTGLRIFPGPLPDGRMAATWDVPAEVTVPLMWAALDCPGGWSALQSGRTFVLGRIAVAVDALPAPGDRCVVVGTAVSAEGRKAVVDSTVYGQDGTRHARARATWIALDPVS
ncbi:PaaI family thioesterase [Actinoplanes sp. NPDC051859]|uniref:PaaI family thioesterase n=1 Tax=Actinoplanes sp. NPDC051859 TaxID=3363909 RepID=UPI00378B02FD